MLVITFYKIQPDWLGIIILTNGKAFSMKKSFSMTKCQRPWTDERRVLVELNDTRLTENLTVLYKLQSHRQC